MGRLLPAIDLAIHINQYVVWSFVLFGMTFVLFSTVRATGAVLPPLTLLAPAGSCALGVSGTCAEAADARRAAASAMPRTRFTKSPSRLPPGIAI